MENIGSCCFGRNSNSKIEIARHHQRYSSFADVRLLCAQKKKNSTVRQSKKKKETEKSVSHSHEFSKTKFLDTCPTTKPYSGSKYLGNVYIQRQAFDLRERKKNEIQRFTYYRNLNFCKCFGPSE